MPDLTPRDFHRIRTVLDELVLESNFFPAAAKEDVTWFRPRRDVGEDVNCVAVERNAAATIIEERRRMRTHSEDGRRSSFSFARRPRCHSMDTIESSSSLSTSSGSSLSSSFRKSLSEDTFENRTTTPSIRRDDYATNAGAGVLVYSIGEEDIVPRSILGVGGFCEVRLVKLLRMRNNHYAKGGATSDTQREQQLYAMKYLIPPKEQSESKCVSHNAVGNHLPKSLVANRNKRFTRGIADLAIEARFLSLLSHDNIISLHYVSRGSFEQLYTSNGDCHSQFGYFLLLDPMFETLSKRIDETYIPQVLMNRPTSPSCLVSTMKSLRLRMPLTRQIYKQRHGSDDNDNKSDNRRRMQLNVWKMQLAQRLDVVKGVASALQYMHDDCNVVFRDVKPDNIGFYRKPHPVCCCGRRSKQTIPAIMDGECICYDEIPKLFDFGLCKELKSKYLKPHPHHHEQQDNKVDTYNLTARSGSRRYMAPEVARSQPYNEKADVYSFGILLYQMASLLKPFEGYSLIEHEDEVLCRGHRPDVEIPSFKGSSSFPYSQWFAPTSVAKSKDMLELRTKCVWTEELTQLITECWQGDMRLRPTMRDVVLRLEGCLQELTSSSVEQITAPPIDSKEVLRMAIPSQRVAKALRVCATRRRSSEVTSN